ncbi:MAG: hypothetical protein ACYS22_14955 [Planctomycetota bacterium]
MTEARRGTYRLLTAAIWALLVIGVGWVVYGVALEIQKGLGPPPPNTWLRVIATQSIYRLALLLGSGGSLVFAIASTVAGLLLGLRIARRRPDADDPDDESNESPITVSKP